MNKTELKEKHRQWLERGKELRAATLESLVRETAEQQEKRIRFLLRPENYNAFFDYYFGINSPYPLADAPSARFHQESYERVFHNPFIVQIRQWFRGAAKSLHTNVGNITHLKENKELFFAVIVGQTEDHAKLLLSDLQLHLQFNERYIKDFGIQHTYGSWAEGEFEAKDGTFFKAIGIDQPFRGLRRGANRVDFCSVDDVEDRKIAKNKQRIKERGEKITGDIMKGFSLHRGRLVVANNYIVKGGLLDYIKNELKDNPNLEVHTVNLSDKDGNPSWPERYTREMVAKINSTTDYYTSQREDYNNPIEKGKLFKEEWIRFRPVPDNVRWELLVSYWDLSYKATGDFKANALVGVYKGKLYVIDLFARQCDITEAMRWHFQTMKKLAAQGLKAISYYDATAAQKEVFHPIWIQEASKHKFFEIPIPDLSQRIDKHLRIEATLTNVLYNGTLVFDKKLEGTADMETAKRQLLAFEKGTKEPDDFPDALENAVRKIQTFTGFIHHSDFIPVIKTRRRGGF